MKKCNTCTEEKPIDEFYYFKTRGYYYPSCKKCTIKKKLESNQNKLIEDGYKRPRNLPNVYNSELEKQQLFELMERLDWVFNIENNMWYKEGVKSKDGKWNI